METSANRFVSENGVRYLDPLSTQKNMWPYSYIILYILGLILYSLFYGYLEGLSTNQWLFQTYPECEAQEAELEGRDVQ